MKTILVIEDEQTVRESILDLLEAEGFRGIGGENGQIGVQLAHDHHPDLILCDVTMPDCDGFSVLTQLRTSPDTSGIPFIFLSARSAKTDQRQGMELGADDYLTKPCTATDLLGAVVGRLAKYEALAECYSRQVKPAKPEKAKSQPVSLPVTAPQVSGTRDGLLNHFYQELRNPLSNINMALHLLRLGRVGQESAIDILERDYGRELAVLQAVYQLQEHLIPESAELLRNCNLAQIMSEDSV
ncbi:response regulator [Cyanobacteria bacterium FACHB-DQ100]|uniref:response regulator transcription factor n=1 Tax=Leptolyngbya sp. DQ-M1 TaxID=2933920 RepID=UPI00199FD9A2|nr:response regulator [Cyanobacteria bacterium FACHB-DQ100]